MIVPWNTWCGCHWSSNGRSIVDVELTWKKTLKYCQFIWWTDRWYTSVAVACNKYCIVGRVQRAVKINCYMWKICHSEPQSHRIWQTGLPANLPWKAVGPSDCGSSDSGSCLGVLRQQILSWVTLVQCILYLVNVYKEEFLAKSALEKVQGVATSEQSNMCGIQRWFR